MALPCSPLTLKNKLYENHSTSYLFLGFKSKVQQQWVEFTSNQWLGQKLSAKNAEANLGKLPKAVKSYPYCKRKK
jgi:hypothetical protein